MDSGKSSLTLALLREGFSYLSDEFGALDPVSARAYPVERPIALDPEGLELFPGLQERLKDKDEIPIRLSRRFVRPHDVGARVSGPTPVRWIVFPQAWFEGPPRLTQISRAEAVTRLLARAFNADRYAERALILLSRIAQDAEAFELMGGSPLERAQLLSDSFS
jgi:hypothetical protein